MEEKKEHSNSLRKFILELVEKKHPASDKPITKILEKLRKEKEK